MNCPVASVLPVSGFRRPLLSALLACAALAWSGVSPSSTLSAQEVASAQVDALHWRPMGPTGGRTDAVAGEPGNPLVMYAGAASGGVWRTLDGGINWEPVFDDQDVSSIGALAVAPSAPEQIWAGTGETFYIRGYTSMGDGIYRSTDRGGTWRHVGLEKTGRIGRIIVDPHDPDVVYACALGDAYNPQPERGVFKTTDGGKTWDRVLFVDENTGCSDLAMDPHDPQTLFAGTWQVQIRTWNLNSGGPGSGIFVTHDGGATWERLHGGLPEHPIGKTSVDVAASDPSRVYALVEDADPGLYRSDDGGKSWRLVNRDHAMLQRAAYYTRVRVAPDDRDRLYFLNTSFAMSYDGGRTVHVDEPTYADDNHDMWIDPLMPRRMLVAFDHGVFASPDGGKTWNQTKLPLAQMYHVAVDDAHPYNIYSNRQDGPAYMGPSDNRVYGRLGRGGPTEGDWRYIAGCESGFALPDTANDRVWGGCYDGGLQVMDLDNMQVRTVDVWPESGIGWAPKDVRERWYWVFPIALSPNHPGKVYIGSQRIHTSSDGGQSFQVISPDLTRDLESHEGSSGGISADNLMTFSGATLYSIAESPLDDQVIWAGSNDGLVHVTRDGGETWTDVTKNIPGIPQWGLISNVEPSVHAAATAYISVDDHLQGDFDPFIFKTTDYGASWKLISGGIPHSVVSNVHMVKEDPVRPGLLFAGTEDAVYVSLDDGAHWSSLQADLPHVPAYWFAIHPETHDLVAATFGRGVWVLDDVSPFEQMDADVLGQGAHLFQPRDPYRYQPVAGREYELRSQMRTENPPYGLPVNYWLGQKPDGPVKIEILDAQGNVVRTLDGTSHAGLNRVWWNLRYQNRNAVRLRMPPPNAMWKNVPQEGIPSQQWGGQFQVGPRVVPGTYTVRLTANGQTQTREFQVHKDPNSHGTLADIQAQVALGRQMLEQMDAVVEAVNRMEWTRRQLRDLEGSLPADSASALMDKVQEVSEKGTGVEELFMDVHRPGGAEEFETPMKLYGRYLQLMQDLDNSADFPPTDQEKQVQQILQGRLTEAQEQLRAFFDEDLAQLNELLRQRKMPVIS